MLTINRQVTIMQRVTSSAFTVANNKIFGAPDEPLTANAAAEKKLLPNYDVLSLLMGTIVNTDIKSPEWRAKVNKYFHEIYIPISAAGKKLDISYDVNINDMSRGEQIKKLKGATDDKTLAEIVEKLDEVEKIKYVTPVNDVDYFAYLFALNHSHVANHIDDQHKSSNIRFYMVTDSDITKSKEKLYNINKEVRKHLTALDESDTLLENTCIVFNIRTQNKIDKMAAIELIASSKPSEFLMVVKDTSIKDKVRILQYIHSGLLFEIPNTKSIVDGNDRSKAIGTSIKDAIQFFNDPINKEYVDAIQTAYTLSIKGKTK